MGFVDGEGAAVDNMLDTSFFGESEESPAANNFDVGVLEVGDHVQEETSAIGETGSEGGFVVVVTRNHISTQGAQVL